MTDRMTDRMTPLLSDLTRRRFLTGTALTGAAAFLAACGTGGTTGTASETPSSAPTDAPDPSGGASSGPDQSPAAELIFANWPLYIDTDEDDPLAAWVWREQPEEWGRLLADSACHLADAISKETGKSRAEVFRTIAESAIHHLQNPPDNLDGEHVDPL